MVRDERKVARKKKLCKIISKRTVHSKNFLLFILSENIINFLELDQKFILSKKGNNTVFKKYYF